MINQLFRVANTERKKYVDLAESFPGRRATQQGGFGRWKILKSEKLN